MRWLRDRLLPREVRGQLHLARGERVLTHAFTPEGTVVATTHALHPTDGQPVPWQHIDRARWSEGGLYFTEEGTGERFLAIEEPGRLAETVHERVTSTIVVSRHVSLDATTEASDDDGSGFRLVARRPPGGSEISWQIHIDEGVDPDDPRVAERAPTALAALRDQMGV